MVRPFPGIRMARKKESFNFEQSLSELESIVARMEGGQLPLEESLQLFEKGINLTKQCQKALTDAEQKVSQLVEKNGEQQLTDFQADDADDE